MRESEKMAIRRRQILKYGAFGALALAAGGITLALQPSKIVDPPDALKCLSKQEYSILFAIAETLLPSTPPFPAASTLQIAYRVDGVLARAHPGVQKEIRQVLALIENAAAATLFDGHPRPFTRSLPATQTHIINSWRNSSLHIRRTAFKAISGLCNGVYYATQDNYGLVGYDGPPAHLLALIESLQETP